MAKDKKRTKFLFDGRNRRVYPMFLGYETMDDARADVQRIAKALGISEKAVGGHLCQASSNPKVTSCLLNMGYADWQIPAWFAWPKEPPAPSTTNHSFTDTPSLPKTTSPSQPVKPMSMEDHIYRTITNLTGKPDDKELWLRKGGVLLEIDASKLPPATKMRLLWCDGDPEPEEKPPQQVKPEPKAKKWTPTQDKENKKRQELQERFYLWWMVQRIGERAIESEKAKREIEEVKQSFSEAKTLLASPQPFTISPMEVVSTTINAVAPLAVPKFSTQRLTSIREIIKEQKDTEWENLKTLAKAKGEFDEENRQRLKSRLKAMNDYYNEIWRSMGFNPIN